MSRRKRLTTEQEQQLCNEYKTGSTPLDLSMKYGIAQNTVWYILNRNNVERGIYKKPIKK